VYNSLKRTVEIVCKNHGSFWQTPNNHINGAGCPDCGLESKRTPQIQFIQEAVFVHGDKYDFSLTEYINSRTKIKIRCRIHGVFQTLPKNILKGHGCKLCTESVSKAEQNIGDFILSLSSTQIVKSCSSVITNRKGNRCELDICVPEHRFAIEYDGIYWHSEQQGKDRYYHVHKTDECEKQGINLLHIFENEWKDPIKKQVWKSIIVNKMGQSHRIYARKCKVVELTKEQSSAFFNANHLQGNIGCTVAYGLIYNDVIVSAMSFGKPRYNANYDWELLRMCNLLGNSVVGGFSRLLKKFRSVHVGTIISYANRRFSMGNVYSKLGFSFIQKTDPSYWYIKNNTLYHRSVYMKHKLKHKLDTFDPKLTEYQNMINNGIDRIWDCGNLGYGLI